jgi:hypothetical protein
MRDSARRRRLSFLAPVSTAGDHVAEIHKTQEESNGAGTFGFLVTLRRMNDVKNAAEGLRGLSWRTDYD